MAYQSAEELSLEDLQRLYLGEGQYPHLAQQLDYTNPAYFIPPANSPSPNHPQDYSFSFPHQSISPSSTSAPIDCAAPTSSSGFDFNAYLDDDYQSGGGAYTPSYGSFSSQTSSFGSATGPSGSPFSNPSSYNERASSFDFPTSSQPFASSSTHFNPFEDHRDSRYDLGKEYQAASVGGGAAADRSLYEANAGAERQGGGMEFDLELNEMLNGGGMETGRPAETTLQATSEQGRHDTLSFTAGSYGHDDEGDYSRRSSIFPGTLTDSPPTTTVELSSVVARVSPILLAPLAIPTTLSPSLHLTQPTPATARPREKGAGTLELEHLLGELVNEERATQVSLALRCLPSLLSGENVLSGPATKHLKVFERSLPDTDGQEVPPFETQPPCSSQTLIHFVSSTASPIAPSYSLDHRPDTSLDLPLSDSHIRRTFVPTPCGLSAGVHLLIPLANPSSSFPPTPSLRLDTPFH